jgi:hypothetical protein
MRAVAVVTVGQTIQVDRLCREVVVQVRAMAVLAITKMDLMALMD